jgi:hypothetical protein
MQVRRAGCRTCRDSLGIFDKLYLTDISQVVSLLFHSAISSSSSLVDRASHSFLALFLVIRFMHVPPTMSGVNRFLLASVTVLGCTSALTIRVRSNVSSKSCLLFTHRLRHAQINQCSSILTDSFSPRQRHHFSGPSPDSRCRGSCAISTYTRCFGPSQIYIPR